MKITKIIMFTAVSEIMSMRIARIKLHLALYLFFSALFSVQVHSVEISLTGEPLGSFTSFVSRQAGVDIVIPDSLRGFPISFSGAYKDDNELLSIYFDLLNVNGLQARANGHRFLIFDKSEKFEDVEEAVTRRYQFKYIDPYDFFNRHSTYFSDVSILPSGDSIIVKGPVESVLTVIDSAALSDKKPIQVLIEVGVLETSFTDSEQFSLSLKKAFSDSGFTFAFNQSAPIPDLGAALTYMSGGSTSSFFNIVSAMDNVEIVSRPKLVIQDRKQAYISVGQNVPFLASTEQTQGGNTVQNIQRKDVGLNLRITPHVIDGLIQLDIQQELSSVTNSSIAADIVTNQRSLSSFISLSPGRSVLIGGLVSTDTQKSNTRVPGLSQVPLLGRFFTDHSDSTVNIDLKLLVKASIIPL